MQIFSKLNYYLILIVISFTSLSANAFDLPIKNINGKDYYYYKVQSKETIYSITHKLKISKEEIIKYNPSVADGLRAHDTLYFPVAKQNPDNTSVATNDNSNFIFHYVSKGETLYGICKKYNISKETLLKYNPGIIRGFEKGTRLNIPVATVKTTASNNGDNQSVGINEFEQPEQISPEIANTTPPIENDSITVNTGDAIDIAILLPFMLNEAQPSKQAQLYTEFYKGFLIAVDSMRNNENPINIYAYDTADSSHIVQSILQKDELDKADIIITPNDNEQINIIGKYGKDNNCWVLNAFEVKNTLHTTNDRILQANIPHELMYDKAIEYFMSAYNGYTPIFLHNKELRRDKMEFVNELKATLDSSSIAYQQIDFSEILLERNIEKLDTAGKYVFIPLSGARNDIASSLSTLTKFRDRIADNGDVTIFGYPEWTTFRGGTLEKIHALNATIYTRFYNDENSIHSLLFNDTFKRWYGTRTLEAIPSQGILGFDTAMFIINSVKKNNGIFDATIPYQGIQTGSIYTQPSDTSGYINNSLYIIRFLNNGTTEKITL